MKTLAVVCVCALALGASPVSAAQAAADQAKKAPAAKSKSAPKSASGARTIEITGTDTMKFDVTEIAAKPGEKIRVVLKVVGAMPKIAMGHNFVLLKPGVAAMEVANAAFNARATEFIPPDMKDKILASTSLAGAGETVEVTFTVPSKPGKYDYICTFPGHFAAGMKGVLTVK